MCGIFGVIIKNNNKYYIDNSKFKESNDLMKHRGPDDAGYWFDSSNKIGFGHRRLSILDLSSKGHQPMSDPKSNITVTYNGEIYNFHEIRIELKKLGCTFISKTDTEVIIHAYLKWGINCVQKFRGMFAFSLYDKRISKLFFVRDRLGIKPLFYKLDKNIICFASEIKSILNYCGKSSLNLNALTSYFNYRYVLGKITLYENIFNLEPGNIFELDYNKFTYKYF